MLSLSLSLSPPSLLSLSQHLLPPSQEATHLLLCLRAAGPSRLDQSNGDKVPTPSHLYPLTHADSSSGTNPYYIDGETEAQNGRVPQQAGAEALDS